MRRFILRSVLRAPIRASAFSVLLGGLFALSACGSDKPKPAASTGLEASCKDGIDNDGDGASDCSDKDCQSPGGDCKPAPELDRTVATTVWEAAAYLWQGDNALQKGAESKALDRRRIAMLKGRVIDTSGAPLAGVKITINGHKEYGYTYSRADGAFDMAVNGGAQLVVEYSLSNYLPVQRAVQPGWQSYVVVPDAGLIKPSTHSSAVAADSDAMQVIAGDPRTDDYGTRQPLVILEPNTKASAELDSGKEQPLENLTVTATEYPISEDDSFSPGNPTDPGGLAYGLEFTVKEAAELGAEHVRFSKPVSLYVENLGEMPVGFPLAVQHYDRASGQWEPGIRGQVIEVLDVSSSEASIDTDGDGTADTNDTLDQLGISAADRVELAKHYGSGQMLWHAELKHFSASKVKAQGTPPADAVAPLRRGLITKPLDNPTFSDGVIIEQQASAHSEPIYGTPYALHYQSSRTLSVAAGRILEVPLVGDLVPNGLKKIQCSITVAGRAFFQEFSSPTPGMNCSVSWDGKNSAGQQLQGQQKADVAIGYVYRDAKTGGNAVLATSFSAPLSNWDARAYTLGGFSIDVHHAYDPAQQIVYFGNGAQESGANIALATKPATNDASFNLGTPDSLIALADGSLIVTDDEQGTMNWGRILKIDSSGKPQVLFGLGASGAAANVLMDQPSGVVAASDGRLIVADIYDNHIVQLSPDGTVQTLVSGDASESPVVMQTLNRPDGIALGARDELYFVDADKIYHLEGKQIEVIAGGGTNTADGIDAKQAQLLTPSGLAVNKKTGDIYVTERKGNRVRKISASGVITTVAGTQTAGFDGDGDAAINALLRDPHGITIDPDGQIYIVDQGNGRIRRITTDGLIQTVIGGGTDILDQVAMAVNIKLDAPDGIAAGPDGSLYIAQNGKVIRGFIGLPDVLTSDYLVPSRDGRTLYQFDNRGKHLKTIDAVIGLTTLTFAYDDTSGLLKSITDVDGNVTTIERNGNQFKGIKSPDGLETTVSIESNGDVKKVTDPLGRTTTVTWENGLVKKIDDPKSKSTIFQYDLTGRLYNVQNPTERKLDRANETNGWSVSVTSNPGVAGEQTISKYTAQFTAGAWKRIVTKPDGNKYQSVDYGANFTQIAPDGTQHYVSFTPDRWFGGAALNLYEDTLTLPSGKTLTTMHTTTKELAGDANILDLKSWEDSAETNDRWSSSKYNWNSRTLTNTSPTGKQAVTVADEKGHARTFSSPGMPTTAIDYYDDGRLKATTESASSQTRQNALTYDENGWLNTFTDALKQRTTYSRDKVGRLLATQTPDQALTQWKLDDADNVLSLTPPGQPDYVFTYNDATKLLASMTPLSVDKPFAGEMTFEYNPQDKRKLTKINHADGRSIIFGYDGYGRLSSQKLGAATITLIYAGNHLTRINRNDGVTVDQTFDGPLWTGSSWSGGVTGDVKATYDTNFWLASLTVNSASTVNFKYDDDGRLLSASNPTAGAVTFTHESNTGFVSGITVGNTVSQQSYSAFGELSKLNFAVSGSAIFDQTVSERDNLGRVKHLTENIQGTAHDITYEYNTSGRLLKQTRDGVATTYTYDSNGNRTSVQVGSNPAVSAFYDGQDRILSYGAQTYTHTDHGDLQTRTDSGKGANFTLTYDELGNLMRAVSVDNATTKTITYVVDGLGRRVGRQINGQFDRKWLYRDSLRPVAEVDAAGVFTHFVYASNNELSGAPVAMIRAGVYYRIVKDHLGSVRLVINAQTGEVAQSIDYDAWGRVLAETGAGFQPFGFAGGLYDADTKLVRFGARDYDPETGRWTNRDPIGFAGRQGNQYLYVDGDPVNRIDPDGRIAPLLAAVLVGGAIGAVSGGLGYALTTSKFSLGSFLAATAGGAAGGALAPVIAIELITTGAVTSLLGAGLLANTASGAAGSVVTSAIDPKQKFLSASTAYKAIASGVFSAAGYVGADKFGRAFLGSQFFAESAVGGAIGASVGTAESIGSEWITDEFGFGENQCLVRSCD